MAWLAQQLGRGHLSALMQKYARGCPVKERNQIELPHMLPFFLFLFKNEHFPFVSEARRETGYPGLKNHISIRGRASTPSS